MLTYFDTKLSMFCFEPSPNEEGSKAPRRAQRVPWPFAESRRRGAERPELLVPSNICWKSNIPLEEIELDRGIIA